MLEQERTNWRFYTFLVDSSKSVYRKWRVVTCQLPKLALPQTSVLLATIWSQSTLRDNKLKTHVLFAFSSVTTAGIFVAVFNLFVNAYAWVSSTHIQKLNRTLNSLNKQYMATVALIILLHDISKNSETIL